MLPTKHIHMTFCFLCCVFVTVACALIILRLAVSRLRWCWKMRLHCALTPVRGLLALGCNTTPRYDDFFIQARQLLPLNWAMQFYGTNETEKAGANWRSRDAERRACLWCFACDNNVWPHAATRDTAKVLVLGTLHLGLHPKISIVHRHILLGTILAPWLEIRLGKVCRVCKSRHMHGMSKYRADLQKMEKK